MIELHFLFQVEFDCIHPEKQKKKKGYKNSGVVSVKTCKVSTVWHNKFVLKVKCDIVIIKLRFWSKYHHLANFLQVPVKYWSFYKKNC